MPDEKTTVDDFILLLNPEGIPGPLTCRPQFVGWKAVPKPNGKIDKVPMITGTNRRASTTDLLTWSTFDKALAAYEAGKHDGIGFVFCSADPFVGVDLDECRNRKTGEIEKWAREILESFENAVHIEVSPSGTGIHVVTRGVFKESIKTKHVEVYGQDRFFTLTGVCL